MENNTAAIQEKIDALAKDEAFAEAYKKVETPAELVALFHKHGIEVPVEIAQELFEPIVLDEELSEDDLENVAGGGLLGGKIGKIIGGAVGYGCGYVISRSTGHSQKESLHIAKVCGKVGAVDGEIKGRIAFPF